ncbi:unnamed protein product [Adineta ricciae]|uniref:Uncharacterized protein n=1 Tax=Adineta ricciae TaxID=249248 RepID=A0A814DQE1_ADIRI|nr:unnamed protein product [Adineta ricciae]CAF0958825.1 unnamed protein product [Adineta ricciae]
MELFNLLVLFSISHVFAEIQSNSSKTTTLSTTVSEKKSLSCSYCETKACRCSIIDTTLNCSSYLLNLTFASNCAEGKLWNFVDFSSRNFESFDSTQLLSLHTYRLSLKSNLLTKIYDGAFDTIADSLIDLDLQMNQLSSISSNWLNSKFTRLQILNLALNQLETFEDFDRVYLPALRELNLSANQIESFPQSIHQWTALVKLDLSFNKLSSVPRFALAGLQNLNWLSFASNRNLSCLVQDSFRYLRSLNYLDLSSTNLFMVDGCIFNQLSTLKLLKIERVLMNCSSCWLPVAKKKSIKLIGQCLDNSTMRNLSSLMDQQLNSSCLKSFIDCSADSCEPGSFDIDSKSFSLSRDSSALSKDSNASKNRTIQIVLGVIFSIVALLIIILIVILIYRWRQGKKLFCWQPFLRSSPSARIQNQHQKQIIDNNPTIIESIVTHGANMDVSPASSPQMNLNAKRKLYNPMFNNPSPIDVHSPHLTNMVSNLDNNRLYKKTSNTE